MNRRDYCRKGGASVLPRMSRLLILAMGICVSGCCLPDSSDDGGGSPQPPGPSPGARFINRGTAELIDSGGGCLVWRGQDGIAYHLFQSIGMDNDIFDTITTPGVTSRLEIKVRTDLAVACQIGTIVEVVDVLEIAEPES